jgi:CMP-N,N'-diacetyllegionaminic acid synthase
MSSLFLITARGGSKGLPGKNIKILGGKPLIQYSIEFARMFCSDRDICLSSDDQEIIGVAQDNGLAVPFIRPYTLATDKTNSRDVILHALEFYQEKGVYYDNVVLLQPTSPFRNYHHVKQMIDLFSSDLDMIVSVKESHYNPYFSLFEENEEGFLTLSKKGNFTRRQDCPTVYAYNGSVYVINTNSLRKSNINQFKKVKKFAMDEVHSSDIDNQFDWWIAEMILEKSLWKSF